VEHSIAAGKSFHRHREHRGEDFLLVALVETGRIARPVVSFEASRAIP